MSHAATLATAPAATEHAWALAWRHLREHRLALVSLVVMAILIATALLAPWLAPYDPSSQPRGTTPIARSETGLLARLLPPAADAPEVRTLRQRYFQPPSAYHWLGTDDLGRDVFSRLLYGSRISLLVGFLAALSSVFVGTILGAIAGYFAGRPLRFYVGPFAGGERWDAPFTLWRVVSWALFFGALAATAQLAWTLGGDAVRAGFAQGWTTPRTASLAGVAAAFAVVAVLAWRGLTWRFTIDLDTVISRLIDFMLTLPGLPILLVLSAILRDPRSPIGSFMYATFGSGTSVVVIIFILVLFGWITTARLVRASFLTLREREFTMAAQALGTSSRGVMFRHLVPNSMAPIIVEGTLQVGIAILVEAALSFLGFGIQPPVSTWGNMLTNAQTYIFYAPWLAFPPGVMIVTTVLSINFLGDGLRDALDPYRKR
jgi:peptide/nickel transport system permease protein